ncbi:MAG: acyl-CoA thioesterase II [Candidatus Thiodiazotropha sp.]
MSDDLQKLLAIIKLREVDEVTFIGDNVPVFFNQVFGGQILAQALSAALRTVPQDRIVHSSHAYFIRRGNPQQPITFTVENVRDGGSFNTRRVVASQQDQSIFITSFSFQTRESGHRFQVPMPATLEPDTLGDESERWNQHPLVVAKPEMRTHFQPLDIRHTAPVDWFEPEVQSPQTGVWMRTRGRLPDQAAVHQSMLAYFSDFFLYGTSLRPHALSIHMPSMQSASLDHSIWFHDDFRADEWLYYDLESSWTGNARGLNFGKFFTRDGRLVASTAQEGLMRVRKDR